MTKSQSYSIEMEYTGVDRSCQSSTRKLTVITARPVINGGNSYVAMWPNVFKSLAPGNEGSLFYANPFVKFKAEFRSQGEQVKLIPRLVQTLLSLTAEEGIQLSTKCGEKYENHWVANNTLVELPYFCSAYTSKRVFLRSVLNRQILCCSARQKTL